MTVAPSPLARATPFQRQTVVAYIRSGSVKAAAASIGITERAANQRLQALYRRTGLKNIAEAAYWLGWETAAHRQ